MSADILDYLARSLALDQPWMLCEAPSIVAGDDQTEITENLLNCVAWARADGTTTVVVVVILSGAPPPGLFAFLRDQCNAPSTRIVWLAPATPDDVDSVYDTLSRPSFCVGFQAAPLPNQNAAAPFNPLAWTVRNLRLKRLPTTGEGGSDNEPDARGYYHEGTMVCFRYQYHQRESMLAALAQATTGATLFSRTAQSLTVLQWSCAMLGVAQARGLQLDVRAYTGSYVNLLVGMFGGLSQPNWGCAVLHDGQRVTDDARGARLRVVKLGGRASIACDGMQDKHVSFLHNVGDDDMYLDPPIDCRSVYMFPLWRPFAILHLPRTSRRVFVEGEWLLPSQNVTADTTVQLNYDTTADVYCVFDTGVRLPWKCRALRNVAPQQFVGAALASVIVQRADGNF